ncbi:hypothetical protein M378DRAFT_162238 [Amanita muscaria Koide BX008]|uniref:Uncharacterized protein n=1 Tax=Amanita muscaria (strain Koide BX008) TaxID=946122 RepID=A0A0C2WU58_AMAMK|nr:hypothetical protein M378DRAFT_162238 [Amanita muscaria Koide BX008]
MQNQPQQPQRSVQMAQPQMHWQTHQASVVNEILDRNICRSGARVHLNLIWFE